jgi:formylglycine-generating enzyme required for sulfatase activity
MKGVYCMKTRNRAFACFMAITVCGFVFTGCNNGSTGSPETNNTPVTVPVTGVTLTGEAEFGLLVDDSKTLSYTVSPANASNKRVRWTSSNPRVAIVVNGEVTALAEGTADITVITDDGHKSAFCTVNVGRIVLAGITLDDFDLWVGDTQPIPVTFQPENATNKSLLVTTSDRSIVAVTADNKVLGVKAGTATITVRTHNSFMASCVITVSNVDVTGVDLDITGLRLDLWKSQVLTHTVQPLNATFKGVSWESSNEEVAVVIVDGTGVATVFGVKEGPATITVTADEGDYKATCDVTVVRPNIPEEKLKFPLVLIPDGTFMMGSPEDEDGYYDLEGPPRQVTLTKSYYMGAYGVSQALYKTVTGHNPSYFNAEKGPFAQYLDVWPVDTVTWYDAIEFCNRLSYLEGLQQVYKIEDREPVIGYPISYATVTVDWTKNGYRLPTEAEWEHACRADTTTVYNTGKNTITINEANFDDNTNNAWGQTTPSNMYAPNAWGLYDMHGNLEEWCWDEAYYYSGDPTDPTGPDYEIYGWKILRGGSWNYPAEWARSASRNIGEPSYPTNLDPWYGYYEVNVIGFRVVRNGDGPAPSPRVTAKRSVTAKQMIRIVPQGSPRFDRDSAPSRVRLEVLRRKVLRE